MMPKFILLAYLLDLAIAAPQLLTFNNGKFGVNFGGYHAEAGLGGLLTGNAAHGGLSASAGTPYGQRASAGLGGSVDGNAAGVLYAGAQASPEVGAEALIGGDTGKGGFSGARAFNSGRNVAATKTYIRSGVPNGQVDMVTSGPSDIKPFGVPADSRYDVIQKVRPPKKYLISPNTLSIPYKHRNYGDHKTTATPHTGVADAVNRENGISTLSTATKISNHNGGSNGVSNDDTFATSSASEVRKYAVKASTTHFANARDPTDSTTAMVKAVVANDTASGVKHINYTQRDDMPQLLPHASDAGDNDAPIIRVVNRQRMLQKGRTRPQHQRHRQRQRQREQFIQTQRIQWKQSGVTQLQGHLEHQQKGVGVQQATQVAQELIS